MQSNNSDSGFYELFRNMYNNFQPLRDFSAITFFAGLWKDNTTLTFAGLVGLFSFYARGQPRR